jgi:L-lactate dehydrogenase complex protein LldG
MSAARDDIIGRIRGSLGRGAVPAETAASLAARVAAHRRNLVPARAAALDASARIDLFVTMAEEVQTTVARVTSPAAVAEEVARYLTAENLPAELVMAPDPGLDAMGWETRPMLRIRRGKAEPDDMVSVTPCLAAIAETGTLMLVSGGDTPTTLNFLPDTHVVVVRADQVVAGYEDGWDLVRAHAGTDPAAWPRTVNFITGPSRTGDIEQRIQLGVHGPRRLHVVVVDGAAAGGDG